MESYEVLRKAINNAGVKAVAADMNLSSSLVYKWCQPKDSPDASGTENPLDRIAKIYELTGDRGPISWLCQRANGFFVQNKPGGEDNYYPLLSVTQQILKEFSELLEVVSKSIEDDRRVDKKEAATIRREWEELKAVAEGFVVACEKGSYRKVQ